MKFFSFNDIHLIVIRLSLDTYYDVIVFIIPCDGNDPLIILYRRSGLYILTFIALYSPLLFLLFSVLMKLSSETLLSLNFSVKIVASGTLLSESFALWLNSS